MTDVLTPEEKHDARLAAIISTATSMRDGFPVNLDTQSQMLGLSSKPTLKELDDKHQQARIMLTTDLAAECADVFGITIDEVNQQLVKSVDQIAAPLHKRKALVRVLENTVLCLGAGILSISTASSSITWSIADQRHIDASEILFRESLASSRAACDKSFPIEKRMRDIDVFDAVGRRDTCKQNAATAFQQNIQTLHERSNPIGGYIALSGAIAIIGAFTSVYAGVWAAQALRGLNRSKE